MSGNFALDVQMRSVQGKKVKLLRQQGILPATIYGKGFDPLSVQIDERTFNTTYRRAGRTALIELNIPGQAKQSVFVQDVQRHPVTRAIIHADLRVVDLKQAMNVEVPVVLIGESPLVKRGDGLVNHGITTIEVHALPADIPQHLEVDISALDDFDKSIYVRDLPTSTLYTVVTDGDELIASIAQLRATTEEEEAAAEAPAEPELIRKGKKDDEGGEEE